MRKHLLALFLLAATSLGLAQTATVSGTVKDPSGTAVSGVLLRFELKGCAGNLPIYAGNYLVTPFIQEYTSDGSGVFSGSILRNDYVTCGGVTTSSYYAMTVVRNGVSGPACNVRITAATLNANQPTCLNALPNAPLLTGVTVTGVTQGCATWNASNQLTSTGVPCPGGSSLTGAGTANKVTKFSAASTIADSGITDSGSVVSIDTGETFKANLDMEADASYAYTIPVDYLFQTGGCTSGTAGAGFDLPAANAPTAVCITGSNNLKGVLRYDNSGNQYALFHMLLPDDFTGNIDARITWSSKQTAGSATWELSAACALADGTSIDDQSFTVIKTYSASSTPAVVDALKSTIATGVDITSLVSSCTSGRVATFKLKRTDTNVSLTGADVAWVRIKVRRRIHG